MEPYHVLNRKGKTEGGRPGASVLHLRSSVLRLAGALLRSSYMPLIISMAAIAVSLPTLNVGFLNDDYMHRAILVGPSRVTDRLAEKGLAPHGTGRLRHALSETFVAVHPEGNLQPMRDYGALAWWTYDGFRVAFWRPVASLTQWLDYRLFPSPLY